MKMNGIGSIASWAIVLIALVSGAAAWVSQSFSRVDTNLTSLEEMQETVWVTRERLDQLVLHVEKLDTMLQREMRLINDETSAKIDGLREARENASVDLDRRLQDEIKLRYQFLQDRIDEWKGIK